MTVELPSSDVVQFFKALADETRLQIVRLLSLSDLRVGEIVERLSMPHNRVSYHLRQLRSAGLLRDRRSSFDGRDVYYSVDVERLHTLYAAAGDELRPGTEDPAATAAASEAGQALRVLFLCTHNSARSQMAEAIIRLIASEQVEAYSAGSDPAGVHPMTLKILEEWDIDTGRHTSKLMNQFIGEDFDYIITVCDRVREVCPTFPGDPGRIHWSIPDPVAVEGEAERRQAFDDAWRELSTRIRYLLLLPHPATGRRFELRSMNES